MKQKILQKIGWIFLPKLMSLYLRTLRIEKKSFENLKTLQDIGKNSVIAFWHSKMFVGWYLNRNKKSAALVSKSKDGDLLTRILKNWKYEVARGSSHKGGKEALEMMIDFTSNGYSLCITPDGPTGPPHKMKAGCVITAKKTSVPLFLLGIGYSKKIKLKSWDKMEIPFPFSKVVVMFNEPIYIDKHLSYEETSNVISQAEQKLNELNYKAEKLAEAA